MDWVSQLFFGALTLSTRVATVSSEDTHAAQVETGNDSAINPRRLVCAEPVARFLVCVLASLSRNYSFLTLLISKFDMVFANLKVKNILANIVVMS